MWWTASTLLPAVLSYFGYGQRRAGFWFAVGWLLGMVLLVYFCDTYLLEPEDQLDGTGRSRPTVVYPQ